jgi:hypothetical protein
MYCLARFRSPMCSEMTAGWRVNTRMRGVSFCRIASAIESSRSFRAFLSSHFFESSLHPHNAL